MNHIQHSESYLSEDYWERPAGVLCLLALLYTAAPMVTQILIILGALKWLNEQLSTEEDQYFWRFQDGRYVRARRQRAAEQARQRQLAVEQREAARLRAAEEAALQATYNPFRPGDQQQNPFAPQHIW